jgi:hypothetical protein
VREPRPLKIVLGTDLYYFDISKKDTQHALNI